MSEIPSRLSTALADRYTMEREIGSGGMATVYLAEDLRHDRPVALKVLKPELAAALGPDRFLREIKTTAQLRHPHILPLLDSGDADGTLFYVMPYVEGESLRDRLNREKQLPVEDALRIAREVADALSYAHSHDVLHRDIKPENILLESGHAVVADFGIARALTAAGGEKLTETGMAVGTPAYMSPEQSAGEPAIDGRSDLYALGCVLYEMLAGEPPFTGPTAQAIIAKRLAEPPPRVSVVRDAVPASVDAALTRALARVPADRFGTAAQFAQALTAAAGGEPSETRRTRPLTRRVVALIAGLTVVAAGVGVVLKTGVLRPPRSAGGAPLSSLAVLPVANLSGDSTQEYFADGMTEALITELGKVSALTVLSRTSVIGFKGSRERLPEIARQLNVEGILESSVLREGGHVRIIARLIDARDARTERSLWTDTYDRDVASILVLYAEVARTIAGAIGATLTPEETRHLQVSRRVDPQAYDEYLLGTYESQAATAAGQEQAMVHYRRAIALDPTFAEPHAGIVEAYWGLSGFWGSPSAQESAPLVQAAAERAVALDPGSALAHAALAHVRSFWEWRWDEADGEYRRALELNSGLMLVHFRYSDFLLAIGRYDEAVKHALRAVELDPRHALQRFNLAAVYFYAGRFQQSIAAAEKAVELDSSSSWSHLYHGWNYSVLGRHPEAIEAVDRALRLDPENQWIRAGAAVVYARAGRTAVARRLLDSLLTLGRKGTWVDPYNVGFAYAWLGETDRALDYFNRAVEQRSLLVGLLRAYWLPDSFKADPRYHALLRRINLE